MSMHKYLGDYAWELHRWTVNRAFVRMRGTHVRRNGRGWSCDFVREAMSLSSCSLLLLSLYAACSATPLDDYVNAPDPTYEYRDLGDPWRRRLHLVLHQPHLPDVALT